MNPAPPVTSALTDHLVLVVANSTPTIAALQLRQPGKIDVIDVRGS
jgi:hypothetical protein